MAAAKPFKVAISGAVPIILRFSRSISSSAAAKPFKVAITGAGPAGLVVAGILSRAKSASGDSLFSIDLFERDQLTRGQGAGWDIDEQAQKIFERAGLDWRKIVREGSDTWRIFRVGDGYTDRQPVAMLTPPAVVTRFGMAEYKVCRPAL